MARRVASKRCCISTSEYSSFTPWLLSACYTSDAPRRGSRIRADRPGSPAADGRCGPSRPARSGRGRSDTDTAASPIASSPCRAGAASPQPRAASPPRALGPADGTPGTSSSAVPRQSVRTNPAADPSRTRSSAAAVRRRPASRHEMSLRRRPPVFYWRTSPGGTGESAPRRASPALRVPWRAGRNWTHRFRYRPHP